PASSPDPKRLTLVAPSVEAPVLLAEWKLEPDAGQRLTYEGGSLTPVGGTPDVSGFAALVALFTGEQAGHAAFLLIGALILVGSSLVVWRWASREDVNKFSARHVFGTAAGIVAFVMAVASLVNLGQLAGGQ